MQTTMNIRRGTSRMIDLRPPTIAQLRSRRNTTWYYLAALLLGSILFAALVIFEA